LRPRHEFAEPDPWHRLRAFDYILYDESDKHTPGYEQHTELGDKRRNHDFDFPWWIQLRVGERLNEREPNGDDDLHADSDRCLWPGDGNGNSHRNHGRDAASINDNNHFVSKRNAGHILCRLHNIHQRRLSSLRLFSRHEF